MKVNVKEFLREAGITESFYPGKRLVHTCRQEGQFKSHCVVLDWRDPGKIRIEVLAGLAGKALGIKELRQYPVSFQLPTYVDIEVVNIDLAVKEDDEEGESSAQGGGSSSSGGGGGRQPRALNDMRQAFGSVVEGAIPAMGKIADMVVMGTKIAAQAYGNVMGVLAKQIAHAKIQATELLAKAGDFVTKYTPPAFMAPTGDEQKIYRYDREKNADIGFRPGLG